MRAPLYTPSEAFLLLLEREEREKREREGEVEREGEEPFPFPHSRRKGGMEKALTKVGSFWISKKAKEEISSISEDLSVSSCCLLLFNFWVFIAIAFLRSTLIDWKFRILDIDWFLFLDWTFSWHALVQFSVIVDLSFFFLIWFVLRDSDSSEGKFIVYFYLFILHSGYWSIEVNR